MILLPRIVWTEVPILLRAEPASMRGWLARGAQSRVAFFIAAIVVGAGIYGAVLGVWRSPLQAAFTGIKLPLVILLTTLGNALLNAMLAPLLGLNLSVRQCVTVILMTFAIAAVILGGLAPIAAFVVWNLPALSPATTPQSPEYGMLQLTLFTCIAFAGIMGNIALYPLLREWSGRVVVAHRVLLSWLVVNLLLGSQVSWVLRPFIWDPLRPEEFLGPEYLRGSFYETVFEAARRVLLG